MVYHAKICILKPLHQVLDILSTFFRDSSGLGQEIACIRPVQADLDSSSLETDDHAFAGDAPENKVLYS